MVSEKREKSVHKALECLKREQEGRRWKKKKRKKEEKSRIGLYGMNVPISKG